MSAYDRLGAHGYSGTVTFYKAGDVVELYRGFSPSSFQQDAVFVRYEIGSCTVRTETGAELCVTRQGWDLIFPQGKGPRRADGSRGKVEGETPGGYLASCVSAAGKILAEGVANTPEDACALARWLLEIDGAVRAFAPCRKFIVNKAGCDRATLGMDLETWSEVRRAEVCS